MRFSALGLLVLSACATLTPRDVAQHRRRMSAPIIGCAQADTVVPEVPEGTPKWEARCGPRVYDCRGEMLPGLLAQEFHVVCDPR